MLEKKISCTLNLFLVQGNCTYADIMSGQLLSIIVFSVLLLSSLSQIFLKWVVTHWWIPNQILMGHEKFLFCFFFNIKYKLYCMINFEKLHGNLLTISIRYHIYSNDLSWRYVIIKKLIYKILFVSNKRTKQKLIFFSWCSR